MFPELMAAICSMLTMLLGAEVSDGSAVGGLNEWLLKAYLWLKAI